MTDKELLKSYIKQIPNGLNFTEFCNKLEFIIDTEYINGNITQSQKVNLKLMNWRKYC